MRDFLKCIAKFSLILYGITVLVLLGVAAALFFVPDMVMNLLYYSIIVACLLGAAAIIVSLIRIGICMRSEQI